MDEAFNPYAAPKATLQIPANFEIDDCWRNGKTLFLRAGRPLPCRCIKCNEPAVTPIKPRKLYWHPPGWYVLILFWVILYVLVAMAVRRTATIYPGLCVRHTRRRANLIGFAWLSFLASIGLVAWGFTGQAPLAAFAGILLFLVAIVVGSASSRLLIASRIDQRIIQLRGAGRPFLDSLPTM